MRGREASAALGGAAVNEEKADPGDREDKKQRQYYNEEFDPGSG